MTSIVNVSIQESFHHIKQWMGEIDKFGGGHVAKMLVGNKSDLKNKRVVSTDMAQVWDTYMSLAL